MRLIRPSDGAVIAERLEIARSPLAKMVGLLGRRSLDARHALLIDGCRSIHTFFMAFPIDVVFVDDQLCALKVIPHLVPWRLASCRHAHAVVEFGDGAFAHCPVQLGDEFTIEEMSA